MRKNTPGACGTSPRREGEGPARRSRSGVDPGGQIPIGTCCEAGTEPGSYFRFRPCNAAHRAKTGPSSASSLENVEPGPVTAARSAIPRPPPLPAPSTASMRPTVMWAGKNAAGILFRPQLAARLFVRVIRWKLASDDRHLEESSDSAGNDIPFDSRAAADELIAAGAFERQADALARLLVQATKYDLAVTAVIQRLSPRDGPETAGPRVRTNRRQRTARVQDPGAVSSPQASPPLRPYPPFPASSRR